MRLRASIGTVLLGVALSSSAHATPERVVLVRPDAHDPMLLDAWNRLAAELRIHHFEVDIVDSETEDRVPVQLSNVARTSNALAALALVEETGTTSVQVWLLDRVSGKTTMRRIVVLPGNDASSVLAIRAVDLLRGSLREYDADERPPPDVADVEAGPVPEAVVELAKPKEPAVHLFAEAVLLEEGRGFGVSAGPALGVLYDATNRFAIGAFAAGPVLGATLHTENGAATLHQEMAYLEARLTALRSRRFDGGVRAAFGGLLLNAAGQPLPPLVAESDHVVGFVAALGIFATAKLSSRLGLDASLGALATIPRLGVAVASASGLLALPSVVASAGIVVGL